MNKNKYSYLFYFLGQFLLETIHDIVEVFSPMN